MSIIVCGVVISLFTLNPGISAQETKGTKPPNYIETNGRGIIYLIPKGCDIEISNMKDTADLKINNDLIQEFQNRIYLNGTLQGEPLNLIRFSIAGEC